MPLSLLPPPSRRAAAVEQTGKPPTKQGEVWPVPRAIEAYAVNFHIEGTAASMPDEHRARLAYLALLETSPEGNAITALGRVRPLSDR